MSEEVKDIQTEQTATSQTSSYRSIFKATSLFGGVKLYQILIGIIKSKFVAILLGPAGVGIQGLYQSSLDLVKGFASMGLEASAVRDVSEANGEGNSKKIGFIVAVLRKLVWFTGLLGMILVILLSPILSHFSFGNNEHILAFVILSVILLLDQISAGQKVVIQGTRRLKYLAKASAIGVTVGLLVSVPLLYFWGIKGIIPTLIIHSLTSLLLTWYFSQKIPLDNVNVTLKEAFKGGALMLKLGIAMSLSSILTVLVSYALRAFIRSQGGLNEVGLFTAGFAIISSYVGMIFSAMSTDYYPRLASVNKDNIKCRAMVNQQLEIASFIMGPLLLLCLLFMPYVIKLLYSADFLGANDYIFWAITGMLFRLASWAISFQFVAKGESKVFIVNELVGNTVIFSCNMLGYWYEGLTGLGIGFSCGYFIYLLQVYLIARKRYGFSFTKESFVSWCLQLLLILACVLVVIIIKGSLKYVFGVIIVLISGYLSIKGLDNRMNFISIIKVKLYGRR